MDAIRALPYIRLTIYAVLHILGGMYISPMDVFTSLAHDTRLRCLMLLQEHTELCVCELTSAVGATQPHISRHLGLLRDVGLVTGRRERTWVHYRINAELPAWVTRLLAETAKGVKGGEPFESDRAAMQAMSDRSSAERCA